MHKFLTKVEIILEKFWNNGLKIDVKVIIKLTIINEWYEKRVDQHCYSLL